ncbi:MAG: hypothetical protein SGJ27_02285 [Candidatus Melainabacteria bacterium]|nr:hypothetical protein [Candidatus Melainabacteria bacterium]
MENRSKAWRPDGNVTGLRVEIMASNRGFFVSLIPGTVLKVALVVEQYSLEGSMPFVRTIKSLVLSLICLSWSGAMACAEGLSLEGKIEHSEMLHPVDAFKIGADYDETLLPSGEDSDGNWWRVPRWLAGQWEKTGKIEVLSFTDLKTNEAIKSKKRNRVSYHDREVLGHQSDCEGQVWTYVPLPCIMKSSAGDKTNVNVINSFDVVEETKDSLTVKIFCVTVMLDSNNKVISICQRESLQTWTPVNEHLISIKDSTKFFDRDGQPIAAKKMLTYSQRCGGYCPVNYTDRMTHRPMRGSGYRTMDRENLPGQYGVPLDLRNSFAEFLRTHNLTSLTP